MMNEIDDNVCGLCGLSGADKIPHPVNWPNELIPTTQYVHAACEDRAAFHAMLARTEKERDDFLRTL